MKQALQNLLAEGKTAKTIQSLLAHTKSRDVDLHHEVLQISARFADYERQKHANTEGYDPLSILCFTLSFASFFEKRLYLCVLTNDFNSVEYE